MRTHTLFLDLPAALVEELLARTPALARSVIAQLEERTARRAELRDQLAALGLLARVDELPAVPTPTSCGIDGSVAVERLLAHDLLVAGALAVEGLTPPSEQRYWPEPRHAVWVSLEPHSDANDLLTRAMMAGLEIELAVQAPHDVVLLDGSLATPLIAFDQAARALAAQNEQPASAEHFWDSLPQRLELLLRLLDPPDHRQSWVGIPKYTTRREVASLLGVKDKIDDRALLTSLLEPGEYTRPMTLRQARHPHSFGISVIPAHYRARTDHLVHKVLQRVDTLQAVYTRPHRWLPALRIELPRATATDHQRLASVLEVVRFQSSTGALFEPFPLFLADRMIRHLRRATRALRHAVREAASREYPVFEEVFLALESYRSEAFRSP